MKSLIVLLLIVFNLIAFDKIGSFQANFRQIITNKNGKNVKYSGEIYFKLGKNQKILWIYNKPILKKIYIINTKVTIIEPELEQVIITKLDTNYNLIKILKKAKKIDKNLYEARIGNLIYKIRLINKKIDIIEFNDELGNHNKINFINVNQNIKIKDKIFEFNIPYEYDVINKE